jgi:hypothetical protein
MDSKKNGESLLYFFDVLLGWDAEVVVGWLPDVAAGLLVALAML